MTYWEFTGRELVNCTCEYGCPCQFNALPDKGHCYAVAGIQIDEGKHGDTSLDGLKIGAIFKWPGAIHEGNGEALAFVDERASEAQRGFYEVVRVANERASANVRAGMTGRDADALARDYIQQRGFGDLFGHSLGHGLGLEVHEAPRLAKTADGALAEGAVVTIEPGIYRPDWGGVRIEDDVHLGPGGPTILTHFDRELIELG